MSFIVVSAVNVKSGLSIAGVVKESSSGILTMVSLSNPFRSFISLGRKLSSARVLLFVCSVVVSNSSLNMLRRCFLPVPSAREC